MGGRYVVTVRDVAQRAGVSAMTVSNVINGRDGKVSEATVARVRAAIEDLGYVPNAQARSLAGAASRVLALVYQAVPQRAALASPYESLFVGACEKAARAEGYVLMLCGTSDAQEMVSQLRAWRVDGAIVMATTRVRPVDFMERAGVPSVFIDVYGDGLAGSSVNIDDRQGARLAGERMARAGHRRVLFVGPSPSGSAVVRERLEGLQAGFGQGGGTAGAVRFGVADVTFEDGVAVGVSLANQLREPGERWVPTAVFASGDILAIGVVTGLRRGGVRVPQEMSVVGFDGIEAATYLDPPLTTIAQPVEEKARRAVAQLVSQLRGEGGAEDIVLPVSWREGGTLGPARAA